MGGLRAPRAPLCRSHAGACVICLASCDQIVRITAFHEPDGACRMLCRAVVHALRGAAPSAHRPPCMALRGVYVTQGPALSPASSGRAQASPRASQSQGSDPGAESDDRTPRQRRRPRSTASVITRDRVRYFLSGPAGWWAAEIREAPEGVVTTTHHGQGAPMRGTRVTRTYRYRDMDEAEAWVAELAGRLKSRGLSDSAPPPRFWSTRRP